MLTGDEDRGDELPSWARFHATSKGRLYVLASTRSQATGKDVAGIRLLELTSETDPPIETRVNLNHPFVNFMTATERGGTRPSNTIDVIGLTASEPNVIRYACIEL